MCGRRTGPEHRLHMSASYVMSGALGDLKAEIGPPYRGHEETIATPSHICILHASSDPQLMCGLVADGQLDGAI